MSLIGLDIGTTGCKAVVFDPEGRMLARAFREYGMVCDAPAKAEQDAEQVWMLAKESLREVAATGSARNTRALSVSVQGDAIIPVDRDFHALRPAILGMDYRSAPQAERCAEMVGAFALFQRTGMRPHPMNSLTKVLLLRELAPAVFARAWKIVTYADFIWGKLGAGAVMDPTMASRTMAFDLAAGEWSRDLHARLDLDINLWSQVAPSGTVVGNLRPALADELGLPCGLALVAGGHDQTCAALGAGVVREGLGVVSTGTAEVLSTAFNRPVLSRAMFEGFYPCYRHVKAGMYFTFGLNHSGGISLRWWRDNFAAPEVADAAACGADPYQLIDERLPEAASPVMVVPHFNGSGTPTCDLAARGAIVGLTLTTTRHEVAKALLEGLCFELRTNLEALRAAGVNVTELVAVGGGARSARWLQLKADILNRPIRTLRCGEAACLGAALLAGTAIGVYASLEEAVRATVQSEREFTPRPDLAAQYQERFAAYATLYPALRETRRQAAGAPTT
jgi:xylulokinase